MLYSDNRLLRKKRRNMSINRYLDPRNDLAFKKIFGVEKHKHILIDFLNDVLHRDGKDLITIVELLNPSQNPEVSGYKESIVDVLCTDQHGVQYIVEMQVAKVGGFEKRAQYYASKAYINQMKKGGRYEDLKEVIFLAITDFIMFSDKPDYVSEHVILDRKTKENDLKNFSFTFIELPKFTKDNITELKTDIEKWCYFFKHASEPGSINELVDYSKDIIIKDAYSALEAHNWSEMELRTYDDIQKRNWDNIARQSYIESEARKEGKAEGKAEGIQEATEMLAKNMLNSGLSIEQVSNITNLSLEIINELKTRK